MSAQHGTGTLTAGLTPLCTLEARLAAPLLLPNTPAGTRSILEVLSLNVTGPRLSARMKGHAAADWLILSPDGTIGTLDVRATIETDDGALIFMQYNGRMQRQADGTRKIYIAPRFDTGDSRYAWLNAIQGVGKAIFQDGSGELHYDIYEVM